MNTGKWIVWLELFLILFGLFVFYQIIRKILGWSWSTDELIISLLILNIGFTLSQSIKLSSVARDVHHLRHQFNALANDFKAHVNDKRIHI